MRRWLYGLGGLILGATATWLFLVLRQAIVGESGAWGALVWSLVIGDALSFPLAAFLFYRAFRPRRAQP